MANVNWEKVAAGAEAAILQGLTGLIEGAETDIAVWAATLADRMAIAASTNDARMALEVEAQAAALAEKHRIRSVNAGWSTALGVLRGISLAVFNIAAVAA